MSIALSSLTDAELSQLVAAFDLVNDRLDLLIERSILNEDDGVDLNELFELVFSEEDRRAIENAEFVCEQGITLGHLEKVIRPDGEIGFALTDAGFRLAEGLS